MAGTASQTEGARQPLDWNWDKVVLNRQELWKAIPFFYMNKRGPILAPERLGHPAWMEVTCARAAHSPWVLMLGHGC